MDSSNQTVLDLFAAWRRFDLDGAVALITDDMLYREHPTFKPVRGKEAITEAWRDFHSKLTSYKVDVRNVINGHDVVAVERVENFDTIYNTSREVSVTGVFEFKGGKISAWRDYWDVVGLSPQYAAEQAALNDE